jgi:hypothetical protein
VPEDLAGEASRSLLEYGVLGSLVVLLSIALYLSIRALIKAKDDHLADKDRAKDAAMKQAAEAVELAKEMDRIVQAMTEENEKAHKAIGRKLDALAASTPGLDQAEYLKAVR